MYTSGYAHRSSSFSSAASKIARVSTENTTAGLISEVVYREDQPMMTQLLLLPLLQQLGQQSRWQRYSSSSVWCWVTSIATKPIKVANGKI